MSQADDRIAATAQRHGLSEGAVRALDEALRAGLGGGAQWSHPDLGGMGQWTRSGMLQIGDMFNHVLKGRVAAALDDLAAREPAASDEPSQNGTASSHWWPHEFGSPSSTGAQNAMRYACFPERKRLVVDDNGTVTVYDTGTYRLTGVSQSQGERQSLRFSGPDGTVTTDALTVIR